MARSQLVLSAAQLQELRQLLAQFGQQADVRFAFLGDLSGLDIVSWDAENETDVGSVAALAAGDMMATLEVGRLLGGKRACNLIVQEHEDQTILISRVGEALILLVSTSRDVPLGWSRLAIKRASDRILAIVGSAAMVPPPDAISEDFERSFAAQLDNIW
ncbi:response regulator receiver [Oscillochloris trichoides DG-6]|uniref:Response regulator receiver n=1 Tax=Oscillochloris trichoides DG-6 TaxID=765420 RepID=E1IGV5_9CHLR|nr:roadblock/LC7 domain-containing protein [Oscillochloris trichoides]EFO79430.1 response regulator receiver [Oscillochloris trichoides DG-6]